MLLKLVIFFPNKNIWNFVYIMEIGSKPLSALPFQFASEKHLFSLQLRKQNQVNNFIFFCITITETYLAMKTFLKV